jgi:hypothetical protein
LTRLLKRYEGTRLGRQELLAEILEDNPDALFKRSDIDKYRILDTGSVLDKIECIAVAIDPAVSTTEESSDTGIVVVGMAVINNIEHFYVLQDRTVHAKPMGWARTSIMAYDEWKANAIVGEVNNGGDMIENTLRTVHWNEGENYTKGEDIYYETIKEVQIPTVIDTQALLQNYYSKNVYKDVLTLPDSLGTVSIIDTITQNKILGRTFNASVKQRTIKETTIVKELPKTQLYWGLNSNFNKTDLVSSIGTGLVLKTKSDKLYQIGGGVLNTTTNGSDGKFSPYVGVGVYWKIKLLK